MLKHNNASVFTVCMPENTGKHILRQLEKTIAERNRLIQRWEKLTQSNNGSGDVHLELARTIAQFRMEKKYWDKRLFGSPK